MSFFSNLKDFFEGINDANKELVSGVKEVTAEFKTDMIQVIKDHNPTVGDKVEKADRLMTTIKNGYEQMPDPSPGPFNPQLKLDKLLKEIKKQNSIVKDPYSIGEALHLKVNRFGYSHHALSIRDALVIHYSEGSVQIQHIEEFAKGSEFYIVDTPRTRSKNQVIQRAHSRLGENEYNLLFNNCEHFVRWCLNGAD